MAHCEWLPGEPMSPTPLIVHNIGSTVRLTLNRPEAANTVNLAMAQSMRTEVAQLDAETRVVVIDANGPVFCGGGDVVEMASATDLARYLTEVTDAFHAALVGIAQLDAIVIAAVGGATAGAGLGLALATDVVVASDRARFLTAYERVGLTPDGGVSYWLPRIIGPRRALSMSVLGRTLDAPTALNWGIVADLVPHDELTETVETLVARLAEGPIDQLIDTRRLYRTSSVAEYARHLEDEARTISSSARHAATARLIHDFATRSTSRKGQDP